MAVALVATSTSGTTDAQGTSRTCPVPAGAAAGYVAVLSLEMWQSTATNPTVTWPAGFAEIVNYVSSTDGFQKLKQARKVLTGADTGNYSMSWTGTHFNQAQCSLWSGVDNTTPLDVAVNTAQNASGTAYPSNALTTANAGDGMLYTVANENTGTATPPTGYTEQQEANYLKTNTKIAGAAGSETISGGSLSASTLKLASLVALRAAAGGGGNSTPAGTAAETDTGQSAGRVRASAASTAAESDTALAADRTRATAAGASAETDTALAAGRSRVSPAGVAAETDQAQTAGRTRATAVGTAPETDVGLAAAAGGVTPAGQAAETDSALPAGRIRVTVAGPATETDTGLSAARTRASTPGTASETDSAQTPGRARITLAATAQELDTAQDAGNPNEILRDLTLTGAIEPDRWRAQIEPGRWIGDTEPNRWATEVEPA